MLGDSFGGFCVLTAMIRGRLPVRAGVVLSGVVDTEAMVDENTFSPEGQALWAKYLGTGDVDEMRRTLREVSPVRLADRIRAAVLFLDRKCGSGGAGPPRGGALPPRNSAGAVSTAELLSLPPRGPFDSAGLRTSSRRIARIMKFLGSARELNVCRAVAKGSSRAGATAGP